MVAVVAVVAVVAPLLALALLLGLDLLERLLVAPSEHAAVITGLVIGNVDPEEVERVVAVRLAPATTLRR